MLSPITKSRGKCIFRVQTSCKRVSDCKSLWITAGNDGVQSQRVRCSPAIKAKWRRANRISSLSLRCLSGSEFITRCSSYTRRNDSKMFSAVSRSGLIYADMTEGSTQFESRQGLSKFDATDSEAGRWKEIAPRVLKFLGKVERMRHMRWCKISLQSDKSATNTQLIFVCIAYLKPDKEYRHTFRDP